RIAARLGPALRELAVDGDRRCSADKLNGKMAIVTGSDSGIGRAPASVRTVASCGRIGRSIRPPARMWDQRAIAQFERSDPDCEIEPGLALQAPRLQRARPVRTADPHVGIAAHPDR